jgi:alanyl-tRNA synthetase
MLSNSLSGLRSLNLGSSCGVPTSTRNATRCLRSGSVAHPLNSVKGMISGRVRKATSNAFSGSRPPYYREVSNIRSSFLNFFQQNGHLVVPSSNIIPGNDPSLLFTSAGMVQFKESFLGIRKPAHGAITTAQKCVRAGGKHNDLDNVGFTARHHTFFEMLGNFSFGAYDKREAIRLAWFYLTKELGLPKERLSVTVLHGDHDTRKAWKDVAGFTDDSLIRECGEEDNFWSMGDVGPCGPCTEIFWDQLEPVNGEQYLEIWNLVFMQNRASKHVNPDGSTSTIITELPVPCIDTGMGLERLSSVLQGKRENYKIDSLDALLLKTQHVVEKKLGTSLDVDNPAVGAALRVIVDHLRSSSFLLAEGLMPGNQGRGYVLRRIIRRSTRYNHSLGMNEPILAEIFPILAESMKDAYPELYERRDHITTILTHEEMSFFGSLHKGMDEIGKVLALQHLAHSKVVPGDEVFKLYETYGFPVDLTDLIAREQGWTVDIKGFEQVFEEQRKKDRLTWKGSGDTSVPNEICQWTVIPKFTGHDNLIEPRSEVLEVCKTENGEIWISIDPCPFYAESGGQVGDRGKIVANGGVTFDVLDAIHPYPQGIALKLKPSSSTENGNHSSTTNVASLEKSMEALARGSTVQSIVDPSWRRSIRRNHTATHLLHSGLRKVLGDHVVQAGSRVAPEGLRFDFAHYDPLTAEQIAAVESFVNHTINQGSALTTKLMTYEQATASGAMALFSEKYDKATKLRVVSLPGFSSELCGGTHVKDASDIGVFKIVNQTSVGTGTRRIEAVTGPVAFEWLSDRSNMVERIADILNSRADIASIPSKVERLLQIRKDSLKEIDALKEKLVRATTSGSASTKDGESNYVQYEGTNQGNPFMIHHYKSGSVNLDLKALRTAGDKAREDHPEKIHALITDEWLVICATNPPTKDYLKVMINDLGIPGGGPPHMVSGSIAKVGLETLLAKLMEVGRIAK